MTKKTETVLIVAIIVAFAIGFLVAQYYYGLQLQQVTQLKLAINTKASIFDAAMHDSLQEHTFLLINTARRSLDSAASFNSSLVALQTSIGDTGNLLAQVYGTTYSNQFVALWNTKANFFINYTNIVKTGDTVGANNYFNTQAAAYEEAMSNYWSNTTNPVANLDKATVKQLITANVNNIKVAIDYWASGNYPAYFAALHNAYTQAGILADVLATGVIQQDQQYFLS